MRSQTAIEFMTTYAFLFIMLALAISVLFFLATSASGTVPSQCTPYAGLDCSSVFYLSNKSAGYSLLIFALANSQSVPVNITGMTVTTVATSASGACAPSFLYPGEVGVCAVNLTSTVSPGALLQGYYSVNAMFCNSGVSPLRAANCTWTIAPYGGYFSAYAVQRKAMLFGASAGVSPKNVQLAPFNALPIFPNNYTSAQNGYFTINVTSSSLRYSFGAGSYVGSNYLGMNTVPFPSTVSSLRNANVACTNPYNSTLSLFSTVLYVSKGATVPVNVYTDEAMEVYYKKASAGTSWQSLLGGAAWKGQSATLYSNTISLSKGLYSIEVLWSNICSSGLQALNMTGLPA